MLGPVLLVANSITALTAIKADRHVLWPRRQLSCLYPGVGHWAHRQAAGAGRGTGSVEASLNGEWLVGMIAAVLPLKVT